MKKIFLLLIVSTLTVIGCSKTDSNTAVAPSITPNLPTIDYATLIVGTWRLVEIGVPVSDISKGCGEGSSDSNNYTWTKTTELEKLTFKTGGAFLQEASSDAVCKGSYLMGSGYISITTDCTAVAPRQPIAAMGKTTLVLQKSEAEHVSQFKYERF